MFGLKGFRILFYARYTENVAGVTIKKVYWFEIIFLPLVLLNVSWSLLERGKNAKNAVKT